MKLLIFLFVFSWSGLALSKECEFKSLSKDLSNAYCAGKTFNQMVIDVYKQQPLLPSQSLLRDLNKSHLYQKANRKFVRILLMIRNPSMSDLNDLAQAYEQLTTLAMTLWNELPDEIAYHHSMINGEPFMTAWKSKTIGSLISMLPENLSPLSFSSYQTHDCSFLTPILNDLWLTLNASRIIDEIATLQHQRDWPTIKNKIDSSTHFLPITDFQSHLIELAIKIRNFE